MAITDYNDGFNNGLAIGINIKGAEGASTGGTNFGIKKLSMKYFPPVKRTRSRSGASITQVLNLKTTVTIMDGTRQYPYNSIYSFDAAELTTGAPSHTFKIYNALNAVIASADYATYNSYFYKVNQDGSILVTNKVGGAQINLSPVLLADPSQFAYFTLTSTGGTTARVTVP